MVSSRSHVTSFTTWCCHNTFTSLTVLPRKTYSRDVHDTYWSLLEGLIRINHKHSPIHHELDPGCTSGVWRHGIPRAHSINSVVAPTDMQPCLPCDTNCHTPTFPAQRVRRLTRARPAFSRSILSHGIVLDFLIVAPSHVECLDLTRHRPA